MRAGVYEVDGGTQHVDFCTSLALLSSGCGGAGLWVGGGGGSLFLPVFILSHPSHTTHAPRDRYGSVYTNLQPRITKTLYEAFGDSKKPLPTQYGAIIGITNLGTV